MKNTMMVYGLILAVIAVLTLIMINPPNFLSFINFSLPLHFGLEFANSIIMFLIFSLSNSLYQKSKDERFLILAGGFFVSGLFNLVHVFTVHRAPYDLLSLENIIENPTLIYLLISGLILPLSIYYALIYKAKLHDKSRFEYQIYINYLVLAVILAVLPIFGHYYLSEGFKQKIYLIMHSFEYINYALFLMLAALLINLKKDYAFPAIGVFRLGLLFLGFGGLFYINPHSIAFYGIVAHFVQLVGLFCILIGIPAFQSFVNLLRFKDELVAYLSLLLTAFYIVFVAIISGIFKVVFPQYAGYVFIECLLAFQLVIYFISTRHWDKIQKTHDLGERDKILVKIYESIRRISNPNIIKNTVIEELNRDFNADNCFIVLFNKEKNTFEYDQYLKRLPSNTLLELDYLEEESSEFEEFKKVFNNIEICFSDVNKYISRCSLANTLQAKFLKEHNIKSLYTLPLKHRNQILGYLILQFKNDYKDLDKNDSAFLEKVANILSLALGEMD